MYHSVAKFPKRIRPGKVKDRLKIYPLRVVMRRVHDKPRAVEKSGQREVIQCLDQGAAGQPGDVMPDRQMGREKGQSGQRAGQQVRRLDLLGAGRQQQGQSTGQHHRQPIRPQRGEK